MQSVSQSVSHSVSQTVSQSVMISQSVNQSINFSISRSTSQTIKWICIRLGLIYLPYTSSDPPKIFTSPQSITKNESNTAIFKCSLEGKPLSHVTWWYNVTELDTSNVAKYEVSSPPSVNNSVASLTIKNLNRKEEGIYSCKAQNYLNTVESGKAYLTVNCKYI